MKGELKITTSEDKDCNCCFKTDENTEVKDIMIGIMRVKLCPTCFDKLHSEVTKVKEINDRIKNVEKWTKSGRYNNG